jgi:Chaperone of endosialidase/Secretion system C-terminal sorting domain
MNILKNFIKYIKQLIMKKNLITGLGIIFFVSGFSLTSLSQARSKTVITTTIPAADPDQIRVENGIYGHRVAGTVGNLGAADQWLGLGPARIGGVFNNSIYGLRIQRNAQGMLFNLNGNDGNISWGPLTGSKTSVSFIQNTPAQSQVEIFRYNKVNEVNGNSFALNGLLGHYVSGNFGSFAAADQWIGIGQPFNGTTPITSIYGNRIQWANQAFIQALRVNGSTKDAITEWGNQGGDYKIRYITNPLDPVNGFRQLVKIDQFGNTLIGATSTGFGSKLEVNTGGQIGLVVNTTKTVAAYIQSQSGAGGFAFGSYAVTSGGGFNIGSLGFANGGTTNFGVYGSAPIGPNNKAGYFNGDIYLGGGILGPSDEKLKTNIFPEKDALGTLKQLNPVTFNFNEAVVKEAGLNLSSTRLQHGLIAQEVEKVLPESVQSFTQPIFNDKGELVGSTEYKSVNYNSIISILIKGLQEHAGIAARTQERLAQLEQQNTELRQMLTSRGITSSQASAPRTETELVTMGYSLSQNTPNPFSGITTIRYSIPQNVRNAQLGVFDLTGKMLLQFNNLSGTSQTIIDGSRLQPGIYIYTLLIDGQEMISKRMVLTR